MKSSRFANIAYFLLRVSTGLMFFQAGSMNYLGWFGGMPGMPGMSAPLNTQLGIGGLLEFYGGIAIMLGIFTRPVAFILSGEMAVAYWQFHAPRGAWPILNHGEAAALMCFIFLFVSSQGGGDWSVDAWWRRRREASTARPTD